MNSIEMADMLEAVLELLETCPWGQGVERISADKICAQDAISMAAAGVTTWDEYVQVINSPKRKVLWEKEEQTLEHLSCRYLNGDLLFEWNDEPGRTKDEVLDLFRHAAKDLRNEAKPEETE